MQLLEEEKNKRKYICSVLAEKCRIFSEKNFWENLFEFKINSTIKNLTDKELKEESKLKEKEKEKEKFKPIEKVKGAVKFLKDGFNGDAARTYVVGKGSKAAYDLINVTEQAFYEGIKYAKKGNRIGDVCHAIGEFVHKNGYSVVREFQGHGIGRQMHEEPGIPNYGKPGRGIKLESGMTLAVEPMVIAGRPDILELEDGWTIITEDGSLAAHYENTILITKNEPEILTLL